jgi:hypothetical protein
MIATDSYRERERERERYSMIPDWVWFCLLLIILLRAAPSSLPMDLPLHNRRNLIGVQLVGGFYDFDFQKFLTCPEASVGLAVPTNFLRTPPPAHIYPNRRPMLYDTQIMHRTRGANIQHPDGQGWDI